MRTRSRPGLLSLLVVVGAGGALAAAPPAPELRIENAAARVVVIPEARPDFLVSVSGGAGAPAPKTSRRGSAVVVDGGLKTQGPRLFGFEFGGAACRDGRTRLPGRGWVEAKDLPLITVRAPLDPSISAAGAIYGQVGPTRSLALASTGCGDWKTGPVRGGARVRVTGASVVSVASVGNGLRAELTGPGKFSAGEANGPLDLVLTGPGRIDLAKGRASSARMRLEGSGSIRYGGEVGALDSGVVGSGRITVKLVEGTAASSTRGSGGTYIGRPKGVRFCPPCD